MACGDRMRIDMASVTDVADAFRTLSMCLDPLSARTVDRLMETARGYVWGMEDHGHDRITVAYGRKIIDASYEFPYMYGIYCCMYELGMLGSRQPIQDAWRCFKAGRDFGDYII